MPGICGNLWSAEAVSIDVPCCQDDLRPVVVKACASTLYRFLWPRLASFHIWILSKAGRKREVRVVELWKQPRREASPEFVGGISDAIMASLLRCHGERGAFFFRGSGGSGIRRRDPGRLLAVSSGAIAAFLNAETEAAVLAARRAEPGLVI